MTPVKGRRSAEDGNAPLMTIVPGFTPPINEPMGSAIAPSPEDVTVAVPMCTVCPEK